MPLLPVWEAVAPCDDVAEALWRWGFVAPQGFFWRQLDAHVLSLLHAVTHWRPHSVQT